MQYNCKIEYQSWAPIPNVGTTYYLFPFTIVVKIHLVKLVKLSEYTAILNISVQI